MVSDSVEFAITATISGIIAISIVPICVLFAIGQIISASSILGCSVLMTIILTIYHYKYNREITVIVLKYFLITMITTIIIGGIIASVVLFALNYIIIASIILSSDALVVSILAIYYYCKRKRTPIKNASIEV
jgi:hypothetical protein